MIERHEVVDAVTFGDYVHERLGVPYPGFKALAILRKKSKLFLQQNPRADWQTFVRVADWARAKKKHPADVWWLIDATKYAFADGYLPELDPSTQVEDNVTRLIYAACQEETDRHWRDRLLSVQGDSRILVYEQWLQHRATAS